MAVDKGMYRARDVYSDRHYEEELDHRHGKRYEDHHRSSWAGRFGLRKNPGPDDRRGVDYKPRFESGMDRGDSPRGDHPYRDFGDQGGGGRSDPGMAGLIFMCNKRTQRRWLAYNVMGMPMAKKRFAEAIVPGMKLFLFEFESRELYGIFEAVSHVGMDLEPKAFVDAEIDFPLQVRFRVVEKCLPLREHEYRDAIIENYYENNRFKFDLSKEQVVKLMRLFEPAEFPQRNKTLHYPVTSSIDNPYADSRDPTSSWAYRSEDHRRDDHWQQPEPDLPIPKTSYLEEPSRIKTSYLEATNRVDYAAYKDPAPAPAPAPAYREYKEPAARYIPHSSYFENSSSAKFAASQRPDPDAWRTAGPEDYAYVDALRPLTSGQQSMYPGGVSSGYGNIKRPPTGTATTEAERYWKMDSSMLQMPEEYRPLYARQYGDAGHGDRVLGMEPVDDSSYRLATKKVVVSEVDYLPAAAAPLTPAPAPLPPPAAPPIPQQVIVTGKSVAEYGDLVPTYTCAARKASYGYPDDASKHPSRYSSARLQSDTGHLARTGIDPETMPKNRYRREASPVYSDAKYVRNLSNRERSLENRRRFEYQQQAAGSYYRDSSQEYTRPKRVSVWDRIANPTNGPRAYGFERKRKEYSSQLPEAEAQEEYYYNPDTENDDSGFVDFKRRNKGNGAGHNTEMQPRRKKIVRPDTYYPTGN